MIRCMWPALIQSECGGPSATERTLPAFATSPASIGKRAVQAAYYAFVIWIPVETIITFSNEEDSGFTSSKLLKLILFGLALINWRLCFRRISISFWMIAWYLAIYALSRLWVPSNIDAAFVDNQLSLIQMAVLFLMSANLFEDADFREALLRVYGWWVSLVAVGMLLGTFGNQFQVIEGRNSILGQDPNTVAAYFAFGAICIAGDLRIFASRRFSVRLVMSLLAISALIMAILQTGSRGGLLVFVFGMLGLAICGGKATRTRRVLIACLVIGVLGVMVLRAFNQGTVAASRLTATWNEGDTAGRTNIYGAAWSMFLEKPLLGYGGANNLFTLGIRMNYPGSFRDTHNVLFALLTEVGLVGAIPFLAAILCALWKAWRHGRYADDALPFALMCGQITISSSLSWYHEKIFWIFFAAAVACGLESNAAAKPGNRKSISADEGAADI